MRIIGIKHTRALLSALSLITIMALALPISLSAQEQASVTAVSSNNSKVKTGPDNGYATLGTLAGGQPAPVSARSADSKWLLISFESLRGWVRARSFTLTGDATTLPISSEIINNTIVIATTGKVPVNLRSAPGPNEPIIGVIPEHTVITPLARSKNNGWFLVDYQGAQGWFARWVVDFNGDYRLLPIAGEGSQVTVTPGASTTTTATPGAATSEPTDLPIETPSGTQAGSATLPPPEPYHVILRNVGPNLKSLYQRGKSLGLKNNRFTKVGDSETDNAYYLFPFDANAYGLYEFGYLEESITTFKGSFGRTSQSAKAGLVVSALMDSLWADPTKCKQGEIPLVCEIRLHKPAFAIILVRAQPYPKDQSEYEGHLRSMIETCLKKGVIPILTTIPHIWTPDGIETKMNAVITRLADEYQVPLWDLYQTTIVLPDYGTQFNSHLTIPNDGAVTYFTKPYLGRYGITQRNLETLEVLHSLIHNVIKKY